MGQREVESRSLDGEANTYSASQSQTSHCQYSQREVAGPPSCSREGQVDGNMWMPSGPFEGLCVPGAL